MHAPNLLKAVLKPRPSALSSTSSSSHSKGSKEPKSRGSGRALDASGLKALSVSKSSNGGGGSSAAPVKMSCLCAPTSHAGSFRCRLHRGSQQSWGGKPLAPPPSMPTPPTRGPGEAVPTTTRGAVDNKVARRTVQNLLSSRPIAAFSPPPQRSLETRPSRLSRVSAASDLEAHIAVAPSLAAQPPSSALPTGTAAARYLKFNGSPGSASGAVLEGGMSLIKKLQTGGKDVMHEVFGPGAGLTLQH